MKRNERSGVADWTNLYVKQFPETWDDSKLMEHFSKIGEVANVSIQRDEEVNQSLVLSTLSNMQLLKKHSMN